MHHIIFFIMTGQSLQQHLSLVCGYFPKKNFVNIAGLVFHRIKSCTRPQNTLLLLLILHRLLHALCRIECIIIRNFARNIVGHRHHDFYYYIIGNISSVSLITVYTLSCSSSKARHCHAVVSIFIRSNILFLNNKFFKHALLTGQHHRGFLNLRRLIIINILVTHAGRHIISSVLTRH